MPRTKYYAYNVGEENDGDQEERQLIQKKKNQQQSLKQGTDANNARKFTEGTYGVSNRDKLCGSIFYSFWHSSNSPANI